MAHTLLPLLVLLFIEAIQGTPIELARKYVDEYAHGIEELHKSAGEHHFQEGVYDHAHYNETAAIIGAHEYDFIIVGSGASGSTLANRLSEVPEWKVLLLEAGGPETPYMQVPSLGHVVKKTKYNWGYTTEPEDTWCLGAPGKRCEIHTGRALGGNTVMDSMIYTRGNAKDYDLWSDKGNKGWCFADVFPYFKRSENSNLVHFDRKHHHQGGHLNVENTQHVSPLAEVFLEAGHELGYKTVDYNGKEQLGFGVVQTTTKHGKRNSAAKEYLEPAEGRQNLFVKPFSHVTEILINQHTKEATGVKYVHDGHLYMAKAAKEVILSAGTFNSAQLLMLSGVGPKEELEKHHIPVISDLKVGKHIKDHLGFTKLEFVLTNTAVEEHDARHNLVSWLKDGKGPLSSPGVDAIAFVKTKVSKDKTDYPDVELLMSTFPLDGHQAFSIDVMPTHPKSTGFMVLKSKDPFHWPLIHLSHLSDPDDHDLETMLAGIKKAIAIAETAPFAKLGAHLHQPKIPDCEKYDFGTEPYWKCAVKHEAVSFRDQTGSCKMGPLTDHTAVVDNELKVHGVHNLRVADASVIPVSITGHLHAALVVVGEKAADLIKHDWQ